MLSREGAVRSISQQPVKDELLVEYATYGMNSQLFVAKYQLYLPDREALNAEIERTLAEVGQ